jgi:hypothetical protein
MEISTFGREGENNAEASAKARRQKEESPAAAGL